ncbi:short-chain fatty acid transporter [Rhodovulum sulfidophilum]|uniref:short-chain fatty acid transporter n=1 Tax=Rhodovulum sulfidophilum TaxID=35806 RepID=UPI001F4147BF|nr:TIGR00366 family protein [Rhodovulum sulfidophilum]MCE8439168.1 TIGR00366 family protein [Rhodovulum sulfidophilum]
MLYRLGGACSTFTRAFIPNPFIFAIILTGLTALLAILMTPTGPAEAVGLWYDGFWNLLTFAMQMTVILLFGYVLASSPPVGRAIDRIARLPKSAAQAIVMITGLAVIFGALSWGLGLIIGAISARRISQNCLERGIKVHYPLAAAAGFSGLIIFNCGLSASAPLLINTPGHFLEADIGLLNLNETILSAYNILTLLAYLAIIPFVYAAMQPPEHERQLVAPDAAPAAEPPDAGGEASLTRDGDTTLAARLENSRILSWLVVLTGLGYILWHFATKGFDLNLNLVNFTLLILGMAAHGSPISYVRAVDEAIGACGQIVLQFPFYAGIMGIMSGSGLIAIFANGLVSISNEFTFPFLTMLSAAVINLFVPSAGGQWAVQGPVLIQAAQDMGADIGQTVIAFGYGDQLTNGLQPMWMLPLLGVTRLRAGDILGYTAVMMLFSLVIFGAGVTLLPLIF